MTNSTLNDRLTAANGKFRWAYVPLGIGGFYAAISILGFITLGFQHLLPIAEGGKEIQNTFVALRNFIPLYWSIVLGFGILSAALGLSMIKSWRIATSLIGAVVVLGLWVYTPFYARATRSYLTEFLQNFNFDGYPKYVEQYFKTFRFIMRSAAIPISVVFLALPGVAQLIAIVLNQMKPKVDSQS